MRRDPAKVRRSMLRRVEQWLRTHRSPRLHMMLIVSATGAFGFLASFIMLKAGIDSMGIRYPLAVGVSYLVFLLLLRLWVSYQLDEVSRGSSGSDYDLGDAALDILDVGTDCDFGGSSGGGGGGEVADALDLDELGLIAVAVLAIFAGLALCLYVVWTGPSLLAEVLVDGIVMSQVYKGMRAADKAHWVSGVVRRTWVSAVLLTVFLAVAGFVMQGIKPGAKSIGPVLKHVIRGASDGRE